MILSYKTLSISMSYQKGPPGNPDRSGGGRYFAADKFDQAFDSGDNLTSYCAITTKQCNDIFNRVRKWKLEGICRLNLAENPYGYTPEFLDEYQVLHYTWEAESEVVDEKALFTNMAVRDGFVGYAESTVQPWRGYSSVAQTPPDTDPDKPRFIITADGDSSPDGPGPYFDRDATDGDLRFAEWAAAVGNSWDVDPSAGGGGISCDFRLRSADWDSAGVPGTLFAVPYEMFCFSTDATDIVIVGKIGSITAGKETPTFGTQDGYDYHWILKPTEYWGWNGIFDTTTGAPL